MTTEEERVPVTLLTGFLGAGKTTLLNHLIQDPGAGRIAVIMNEFGDIGLDHDLIEASTEETVLLESGCLCCSIRGDLSKTLRALMARKNRDELAFDRVVIETTGIADPGPILHTLVVDDLIAPYYQMDGVVTLADAATGLSTLDTQCEAAHQIAMADLIVLTKTDLVTSRELERYEARLDDINASARRLKAKHGNVPTGALFGLSAMRAGAIFRDLATWLGQPKENRTASTHVSHAKTQSHQDHTDQHDHSHGHHHDHDHQHQDHEHHHNHGIISAAIEVPQPISANVFDFWLDTLIALKGQDILRMKGILHVEGMEWPFVFHGVQHIFDAPVTLKAWSGSDTTSRVVIIARNISQRDLNASLDMLRMQPDKLETPTEGMMTHTTEMPL